MHTSLSTFCLHIALFPILHFIHLRNDKKINPLLDYLIRVPVPVQCSGKEISYISMMEYPNTLDLVKLMRMG